MAAWMQTTVAKEVRVAAPFDTLEYAKRLGEGGFTPEQAQAATTALSAALAADMATKADVENAVRTAKLELEAKIVEAKSETIKWFICLIGFQTLIQGGIVALLKIFGK